MKLLNNDFKQTASCSAEKIAAVKSDVLFSSLFTVFVVFSLFPHFQEARYSPERERQMRARSRRSVTWVLEDVLCWRHLRAA